MEIKEIEKEIIKEFSQHVDWTEKYEYIIGCSKDLVPIDKLFKNKKYELKGCQSKIWLSSEFKDGRVYYIVDSDTAITKGIISLLVRVLSGHKPEDIMNAKLDFIDEIGLRNHLSPSRSNGLSSMITQLKQLASTHIKEKLLVTFSGGETSAFMAQWLNKNMQDKYEMLFVFANTGVESNETLEFVHKCEKEFNIKINWIEAKVYHNQRKSCGFTLVDYKTATRNTDWKDREDTPFEEIVKKYNIPNHSRLHCTRELKMNPIKAFAKSVWGKEKYHLALGIRIDEMDRMNAKKVELRLIYPLIQKDMQPMTKKHINFWWSQQSFRLNLKGYQGNCGACYKKSNNKLMQMVNDDINYFEFLMYLEDKYGNPNGRVPQRITVEELDESTGEIYEVKKLEVIPKEEYKNVFFRNFVSTKEIIEMAKSFKGDIVDDSIETESCEVFSNCGDDDN